MTIDMRKMHNVNKAHQGIFILFAGTKTLQKMKVFSGFEEVNWDIALEGLDPHAVGVASKEEITIESQRKSAKKGKKQKKSGFS